MTTINTNQALGFINAVAGLKNINATINNAVKGIYTRASKTAGVNGAGGMAYINEVLKHDAVAKGKSQGAKAVKAFMLHLHEQGLTVGANIYGGKVYTADEIQAAQQAANTFFNDTLQALKDTAAKAKADKAAAATTDTDTAAAPTDSAPTVADNDSGEALPVVGYDDALRALIIPSDALVIIGESEVLSFGALVAMYTELKAKESAAIEALTAPLETVPSKGKKAVNE